MDFIILRDLYIKYWKWVVMLILILCLWKQCSENTGLITDVKTHKEKAEKYLNTARSIIKNTDILFGAYRDSVADLTALNLSNERKLLEISKFTKSKLTQVAVYDPTEIANYYKKRYSQNGVISVKEGTALNDTVGRAVISDLVIGDGAKAETKVLRDMVKVEKQKFSLANNTVDSLHLSLETVSKEYEKANMEKDSAITKVFKAYKKEKLNKNFWKATTAIITAGATYLLITK